ncbi:zonular occludens toxin domain-containing protein [Marinobacterium sedimentorum]|uniref:zonular occludens toxin domain-containing protein n=1 Tax=Marinobacterium sedimentorum TaxID=2927804 RepID=UPI0020C65C3C|nr:zonular occludens toxin domain-containing protein [Marinobacterium sedimentorum]MCP8686068.1 zonular occludens toxin domain-containing protein [Marinobacterium sedimentorum]
MIFLFTGVPGAGKTLNAIKFVAEDEQFKDRPVFYFGIRELTLPWHELSPDDVKTWYELPHGSVVFIDECQNVFPPRNVRGEAPPHVSHLNTHRHYGIDIVLITQHSRLIDTSVRPLVGQHQHYERKYGWTRVKRIIFEKCQDNTDSKAAREFAQIKQVSFDKKYFGIYKSAEVHTHKARVPLKLVLIFLFLGVLLPGFLYKAYGHLSSRGEVEETSTEPQSATGRLDLKEKPVQSNQKSADEIAKLPLDPAEYMKLYRPRIAGIPSTAPIYDELMMPVEAPKTYCVSWRKEEIDHCQCYTQQITKINMSFSACKNIVNHRMWDPTLKTATYSSEGSPIDG